MFKVNTYSRTPVFHHKKACIVHTRGPVYKKIAKILNTLTLLSLIALTLLLLIYVLPLCGEYICIKTLDNQKIKLFTRLVTFVGHVIIFMITFPVDTLSVHTFTAAFFTICPSGLGTASGRTPGGGPSPVRLLANSLKRAAAASARLTPLVAGAALVRRQMTG